MITVLGVKSHPINRGRNAHPCYRVAVGFGGSESELIIIEEILVSPVPAGYARLPGEALVAWPCSLRGEGPVIGFSSDVLREKVEGEIVRQLRQMQAFKEVAA